MNVKELMQLLKLVEGIIDAEAIEICVDDSRDGCKSFVRADVRLTKDTDGITVLAVRYRG